MGLLLRLYLCASYCVEQQSHQAVESGRVLARTPESDVWVDDSDAFFVKFTGRR